MTLSAPALVTLDLSAMSAWLATLEPATPVTLGPLVTLAVPATLTTLEPVFPVKLIWLALPGR